MNNRLLIAIAGVLTLFIRANSHAQTITAWTFDNLPTGQNQSPPPSTGAGLATPLGMSNTYNGVANQTTNYCDVTSDAGSSGGGPNAWRVRGGWNGANPPNGWSTNAPIATQGAEFDVSTVGVRTNIVVTFDLHTTAQAEANLAVLYTTDGINWINSFMILTNAGSANATVQSTNSLYTVSGPYVRFRDTSAPWYNNLTAIITNKAAQNNANFGVRLVNASTGPDCINQSGAPYNSSSGNWRYDNVSVTAAGASGGAVVPFTPGNLVVYRVGDGIRALSSTGNVVYLDEYTTNGTFVQSVPMPTAQNGSNSAFVASGTAGSEGGLALSTNGLYLLATGYATNLQYGASLSGSSSAAVPRLVARVDYAGNIDTTTALGNWASGNNPRSAASLEGFNIWVGGAAGAVDYTTLGNSSVSALNTNDPSNIQRVGIYAGRVYAMTDKGTNGIYAIGSGLPTTANQIATALPGSPGNGVLSNNAAAGYCFVFLTLQAGGSSPDTLYYADNGSGGENSGHGGILKYSLISGTWTLNGIINAFGATGLTAKKQVSGSTTNILLYATSTNNTIYAATDSTGFNSNPSAVVVNTIASAPANTAFRDIAFTPVFGISQCAYALDSTDITAPVFGGTDFMIDVTANSTECTWTASTDVGWITTLSPTSTNGSATLSFDIASNAGGATRTGHIIAAGVTNTVTQPGATNVAFTAGNIVVLRAGDGIGTLTSSGNPIFLDEYTTGGALVQSIPLPTTFYSGNYPFTFSGTARTEGGLALTADGRYLLAAGYGTTPGNAGSTVNGVVARVDSAGNVDTSTFPTNWISGNPRQAVSPDGTNIWLGCNGLGVGFTTFGSNLETDLVTNKGSWNIERVGYFGGQVYGMTGKNTNGLYTIGTGAPTTGNQVATILPGLPGYGATGAGLGDGFNFVFFALQPGSTNYDTLYYADDGNNGEYGGYGGILKYSLVGGTWTLSGNAIGDFGDDQGRTPRCTGLTGMLQVSGGTTSVVLYASSFSNNCIYAVTDNTGFNADPSGLTLTTLVQGGTNISIRDIAFVPQNSAPTTPSNPFATWQGHYFTSAEMANAAFSGPNADPFGKGINNTNQFLAGFNPTNSAAYLHIISVAKTNTTDINVIYLGANGDNTYTGGPTSRTNVLEYTAGTATGSYSNNFVSTGKTNVLSGGTGLGVVANMVDGGGATNKPSRFYRVRVLLP
ncbi:MAG TPA: BACON domain-containing protein [Verrucomicrobiae bacterium]|nr:BACON domain-containing protein [Verrucomicrobiae bacterium]